ncbi:MAG: hypothetical protein AABY13_05135 [Nanoarchaeota archaeon]
MNKQLDPTIARAINPPKEPPRPEPVHVENEPTVKVLLWVIVVLGVLFMAILMIRSVYNPAPPVNKVNYNEWEFIQLPDRFWEFQWQKGTAVYNIPLRYNPTELGNVSITGALDPRFGARKDVYIAVDPSNQTNQQYVALGVGELSLNLMKVFGVDLIAACTRNETASCADRAVVSCERDTNKSIIIIREGKGPSVTQAGNCITVQGEKLDLLQAVDRLLYKFYNVMPDARV